MVMVRLKGDMTWVVELPEGSRPGKLEIMVPEGEVLSSHHIIRLELKFQQKSTGLYRGQFLQAKISRD